MNQEIVEIELNKIRVNPYQPRKHFRREEMEELSQSIRSVGLIQPPVVRPVDGDSESYELISGERRYRAAKMAGMETMPVIVSAQKLDYSAEAALVENIQRVDLNPLEISIALRRLITEFGYKQEELADRVGIKRSTVTNYLRLLSLPKKIQESLAAGEISMGHAKVILSLESFEKQLHLFDDVVNEELSVRGTEQSAQRLDQMPKRKLQTVSTRDCYLQDLEEKLQQRLGTKVSIQGKGKRGKITIDYYDLDDLDRLLEVIGIEP